MLLKVEKLVKMYKIPILGGVAKEPNYLLGVDIPRCVVIGNNVSFPHNAIGTVIHDNTIIEDNVRIYQNVTLGRADVYKSEKDSPSEFKGFLIKEGVLQIKVNRFLEKIAKKHSADSRVKMRTANRTPSKIGGSQVT